MAKRLTKSVPLSIPEVISLVVGLGFNKFSASQAPNDVELLAKTAKNLPSGSTYLEIGTREGFSALSVLLANLDLNVYSVDVNEGCGAWVTSNIEEIAGLARRTNHIRLNAEGIKKRFHFLGSSSVKVSKKWKKPIDFLFIDGDHTEESVIEDFKAWSKFLKAGSYLGFHDYIFFEHKGMKVKTAVDKLLLNKSGWIFIGASEQIAMFRKTG